MPLSQKNTIKDTWINVEPDGDAGGDFFEGSKYVAKLNRQNFKDYLNNKDVALVMFYDPRDTDAYHSKKHLTMAASATFGQKHAFAGVNCVKDGELCALEQVSSLPLFKLYSKGRSVGTVKEYATFTAQTMMKYVQQFTGKAVQAAGNQQRD